MVSSSDPAARGALLDMYLDIETRSWKASVGAGVDRNPERLALFRALYASPLTTPLLIILLDGVPIVGQAVIELEGVWYGIGRRTTRHIPTWRPAICFTLWCSARPLRGVSAR